MKLIFMVLIFITGLVLAVHLAMNASVGKLASNPRMGNAVFWVIGAIAAALIAMTGWDTHSFWKEASKVPFWLWTAGAIGACLVFVIAAMIPILGSGTTIVILLAGQLIGGMTIAHYGLLGSPIESINPGKILGIVLVIVGTTLCVLGKSPFIR